MNTPARPAAEAATDPSAADERAIARYLYLLRTASPAAIESVHADAFRALTAAQRSALLERIGQLLPPAERGLAVPVNGTPVGLARLLTRAESRQPGLLARLFGAGPGVAGWVVPGLLGAIAGAVAASVLAAPLLAQASRALAAATDAGAPSWGGGAAPEAVGALPADPGVPFADPGALPADPGALPTDDLVADAGPGDDLDLDLGFDDLFDA